MSQIILFSLVSFKTISCSSFHPSLLSLTQVEMDSWVSLQSQSGFLVLVFIIMFLVSVEVPVCLCSYDLYTSCINRFDCGNITDLGYPFWGDGRPDGCGNPGANLICVTNITSIQMMNLNYRVLSANASTKTLRIVREDFLD